MKKKICYKEIFFFGVVGAMGYVVHNTLLWLVYVRTNMGSFGIIYFICGACSMVINFFLNNMVVFPRQSRRGIFRFLQSMVLFIGICSIGLCISTAIAMLSKKYICGQCEYSWLYSSTIGTGVGFFWNYFLSKKIIWDFQKKSC